MLNAKQKRQALAAGLSVVSFTAAAEVPAGVFTAITTAVTDVGLIGAAILIVVVAVASWNWLRKPVH